jgi:hypothetical protein
MWQAPERRSRQQQCRVIVLFFNVGSAIFLLTIDLAKYCQNHL